MSPARLPGSGRAAQERPRRGRGADAGGVRPARLSARRRGGRAQAAAAAEERSLPRRDLVELPTFTVDPATARDFDDAVSARREGDGIRIWIHIADVAAHVPPGSRLDVEARRRGNSTYVPGTVEPMLPRALARTPAAWRPESKGWR